MTETSETTAAAATSAAARVRTKEFQLAWVARFGVRVATRDSATGEVLTAKCLFCEQFGREGQDDEQNRKRKRTANVQHFKRPWRGDNIKSHLLKQHAQRFERYAALTLAEKSQYFRAALKGQQQQQDAVDLDALIAPPAAPFVGGDATLGVALGAAAKKPKLSTEAAAATAVASASADSSDVDETAARESTFAAVDAAEGMSRLVESTSLRQQSPRRHYVAPAAPVSTVAVVAGVHGVPGEAPVVDFVRRHSASPGFQLLVDKKIARFVHARLLAQASDSDGDVTLRGFELQAGDGDDAASSSPADQDAARYLLRVENAEQFALTVKYLAAGFSLQRCAALIQDAEAPSSHPLQRAAAGCFHAEVATHSRFLCAMNYQAAATMLRCAWAFSLVLATGGTREKPHTALRVRFAVAEKIHDVHLVVLPAEVQSLDTSSDSRAAAAIQRVTEAVAAVCGNWQAKLVGIATEDASAAHGVAAAGGHHASVLAYLQQAASSPGCYSVWCGARQVEAVVQQAVSMLCDDAFVSTLVKLTGYLRRRHHSGKAIGASLCPAFKSSDWMAMRELLAWFVDNSVALRQHFETGAAKSAPDASWWITLYSLQPVVKLASVCMLSMEGLTTHGAEQNRAIEKLLITLVADGYVDGPSRFQEDAASSVVKGDYRVMHESAEMFIKKQEPFVAELLGKLQLGNEKLHTKLLQHVATMLADAANELGKLRSERARMTGLSDILPAVRPQDLVKTTTEFDFSRLLSLQRERLKVSFGEDEIQTIKGEFKALLAAYQSEAPLKKVLDALPATARFSRSWKSLSDRFPALCRFTGGLASVYSDPASTLGGDGASLALRASTSSSQSPPSGAESAALETALHATQFAALQRLANDSELCA